MQIAGKVALVTGAGSGIGEAVARELAQRGVRAVVLVDRSDRVLDIARSINDGVGRGADGTLAEGRIGDTTDEVFRTRVYDEITAKHGVVNICVPAAGVTRDALAVKVDKGAGKAVVYPIKDFRLVTEVNLIAPIYWALEMVARIAEDRCRRGLGRWDSGEKVHGAVVFVGARW